MQKCVLTALEMHCTSIWDLPVANEEIEIQGQQIQRVINVQVSFDALYRDGNYRLSACPGQVKIEVDREIN